VINWYLAEALQSGDPKLFLRAIQNVARANNMSEIARAIGMSRTSLYWGENTSPEFTTVLKVLEKLGVQFRIEPIAKDVPSKLWKRFVQAEQEGLAFTRAPASYRMHAGVLKSYHKSGPGRFPGGRASRKHRVAHKKK
jgi:probable addiction module antidote protein